MIQNSLVWWTNTELPITTPTFTSICIHKYMGTSTLTSICIHTQIQGCTNTYIHTHTHTNAWMHPHLHPYAYTCKYMDTPTLKSIHIHTQIHGHTHIYIHMHTHKCIDTTTLASIRIHTQIPGHPHLIHTQTKYMNTHLHPYTHTHKNAWTRLHYFTPICIHIHKHSRTCQVFTGAMYTTTKTVPQFYLTPSLPQPGTFSGWKTCLQTVYFPLT